MTTIDLQTNRFPLSSGDDLDAVRRATSAFFTVSTKTREWLIGGSESWSADPLLAFRAASEKTLPFEPGSRIRVDELFTWANDLLDSNTCARVMFVRGSGGPWPADGVLLRFTLVLQDVKDVVNGIRLGRLDLAVARSSACDAVDLASYALLVYILCDALFDCGHRLGRPSGRYYIYPGLFSLVSDSGDAPAPVEGAPLVLGEEGWTTEFVAEDVLTRKMSFGQNESE